MVNCVVNVIRDCLLGFYIFKGGRIRDDYIILCKANTCMAMQTKALMTFFLFKFFCQFSKSQFLVRFFNPRHLLILNGHGSHVTLEAIA